MSGHHLSVSHGLPGCPGSTQNSLPSPPRLQTSSSSCRTKPQRLTSIERSSSCWRLSWLWTCHLPQFKWKIKSIFFPTIFQQICLRLQKYQKYINYHTDDDGSTMPRITPSNPSGRLPAEEESDLEKWWPGGTLHTRLSLMFFSPRRLRISGVNWESSMLTSFRLEQCLVTV